MVLLTTYYKYFFFQIHIKLVFFLYFKTTILRQNSFKLEIVVINDSFNFFFFEIVVTSYDSDDHDAL